MAIGGFAVVAFVIFIALLLLPSSNKSNVGDSSTVSSPSPVSPQSDGSTQANNTPDVEAQKRNTIAEATAEYWKSWKSFRESFEVNAKPLISENTVQNSTTLSSLNEETAKQLKSLSAVNVDPELIEVAASAIQLYSSRARLLQEQANILSEWNAFVKASKSDEVTGAAVLVFII